MRTLSINCEVKVPSGQHRGTESTHHTHTHTHHTHTHHTHTLSLSSLSLSHHTHTHTHSQLTHTITLYTNTQQIYCLQTTHYTLSYNNIIRNSVMCGVGVCVVCVFSSLGTDIPRSDNSSLETDKTSLIWRR